jgi:nucleotide-binding universal stress UspA family protein
MQKILVPVDGSESSDHAIAHLVRLAAAYGPLEVHLLHVLPPIMSGDISTIATAETIDSMRREAADDAMQSARSRLTEAGVAHETHVSSGSAAEAIAEHARVHGCDQIVMGTRGLGTVRSLVMGSVATKVVHLVDIPVTLVK